MKERGTQRRRKIRRQKDVDANPNNRDGKERRKEKDRRNPNK